MRNAGPAVVGTVILALVVAAGAVLALDAPRQERQGERTEQFQRLVGGLGFGPALDLTECAASFDPRVCPSCPHDRGPIPGGTYFCPQHACSVFYYPPLEPQKEAPRGTDRRVVHP